MLGHLTLAGQHEAGAGARVGQVDHGAAARVQTPREGQAVDFVLGLGERNQFAPDLDRVVGPAGRAQPALPAGVGFDLGQIGGGEPSVVQIDGHENPSTGDGGRWNQSPGEQSRASQAKGPFPMDRGLPAVDHREPAGAGRGQSGAELTAALVAVKGVGEWTAHMFMMFSLCRLDILPTGDLGVRKGMQRVYGLPTLPTPDEMRAIAERQGWAPYRSVASWYMWQVIDLL